MKKKIYGFLVLLFVALIYACSDSDSSNDINGDDFDRTTLTASWVNNLLVPAITDLQVKIDILNDNVVSFTNSPDVASLTKVRTSLLESAKVWQHVEMFFLDSNFLSYSQDMNTYPVDVERVIENIDNLDSVIFTRTLLNATQGLPTLDYLVNGLGNSDDAIIAKYQETKYVNYIKTLVSRMQTLTANVISDFEVIKSSNINSVDNTISSYFSIQINDYVQYVEKSFREAKIATPSGTRNRDKFPSISVNPSPESVESLYSPENSKALYLEAYDAIQDFYYGRNYNTDANTVGLQEYLQFLGSTIMISGSDVSLDGYIETLFNNIDVANNNIGNNFFEQTQDFNANFDNVFDAIQEYVIAIKANMISEIGLTIDFADKDGD